LKVGCIEPLGLVADVAVVPGEQEIVEAPAAQ
jgi:hypothetical protein